MTTRRLIATYLISAALIAAALFVVAYAFGLLHPAAVQNLTLQDVSSAVPRASYTLLNSTSSNLTGYFSTQGYVHIAVSEFNATSMVKYTSYPQFITSIIYTANSTASARNIEENFLLLNFSDSYTPNSLAGEYSYEKTYNFSYGAKKVTMYNVYDVAVYNLTAVPAYSEEFPIFQYTTTFVYGNYTVFVTEDGYSGLNGTITNTLAETLFKKMVGIFG